MPSVPIVGAPLAGGPSTPALAAAVCDAGGLGFLAAGYKTADEVAADIGELRGMTQSPFGLNIFFPTRTPDDDDALARYVDELESEASRYGVKCGEPRWTDDDWERKLELAAREKPSVVSFTFGCPSRDLLQSLRSEGIAAWCTVTTPAEARIAVDVGVDALVVQGAEAGGHQSSFDDTDDAPLGLLALLQLVRQTTDKPLVAAGGIATANAIAAVLRTGAAAAQIGTALMLTREAGTSDVQRAAFRRGGPTALTRAFTGRRARGIVNRFMEEHEAAAPSAYPQIHYATAPIRAAARAAGDADAVNLWAGQAYELAQEATASELVARWADELARDVRSSGSSSP